MANESYSVPRVIIPVTYYDVKGQRLALWTLRQDNLNCLKELSSVTDGHS